MHTNEDNTEQSQDIRFVWHIVQNLPIELLGGRKIPRLVLRGCNVENLL